MPRNHAGKASKRSVQAVASSSPSMSPWAFMGSPFEPDVVPKWDPMLVSNSENTQKHSKKQLKICPKLIKHETQTHSRPSLEAKSPKPLDFSTPRVAFWSRMHPQGGPKILTFPQIPTKSVNKNTSKKDTRKKNEKRSHFGGGGGRGPPPPRGGGRGGGGGGSSLHPERHKLVSPTPTRPTAHPYHLPARPTRARKG